MNKYAIFIFAFLFLSACVEPEIEVTEPMEPVCNLDVWVFKCPIFPCDNTTSINIAQKEVQLFSSQQDAIDGINLLASRFTDENGKARFISIDCGVVYVKVEDEINGTYIAYQNLNTQATLSFHEVRFVANNFYDNDDSAGLRQNHVSLEYPTIGQKSRYRYFENYDHISFTPLEYTDVYLEVTITDQLDEHSFIVVEKVDSLYGSLGWPSGGDVTEFRNVWTITEDEVYVSPIQGTYFRSFVWGLAEYFEANEGSGYSFSLVRPLDEEIDMEIEDNIILAAFPKTNAIKDYFLFGKEFTELIGDKASYVSFDGGIKLRVYNKQDGLVRNMRFLDGGGFSTKGFDLVLE